MNREMHVGCRLIHQLLLQCLSGHSFHCDHSARPVRQMLIGYVIRWSGTQRDLDVPSRLAKRMLKQYGIPQCHPCPCLKGRLRSSATICRWTELFSTPADHPINRGKKCEGVRIQAFLQHCTVDQCSASDMPITECAALTGRHTRSGVHAQRLPDIGGRHVGPGVQ